MKNILFALLLAPLCAQADDLLQRDARWNEYRLTGDAKALAPLLADDWMLTHSDGKIEYKAGYLAKLGTGTRVNTAITNEDVAVRRYGGTAVITGASVQSGIGDGKPFSGKFRFTRVWVQRDGQWLMAASHSSRLP
jgi:ketosteroid isomerase-like protein